MWRRGRRGKGKTKSEASITEPRVLAWASEFEIKSDRTAALIQPRGSNKANPVHYFGVCGKLVPGLPLEFNRMSIRAPLIYSELKIIVDVRRIVNLTER